MKIYKYNKGEVHTLEVRETEKMFIYDGNKRQRNFGYGTRFYKEDCCLSHDEAVLKVKNSLLTSIGLHTDRLNMANEEMSLLMESERNNKE